MHNGPRLKLAAAIAAFVFVIDQALKAAVNAYVPPGIDIEIIPGFFNVVNWKNPGAAFGILKDAGWAGKAALMAAAAAALVIMAIVINRTKDRLSLFSFSLIAGGAAGNLIDRVRFSGVIDFLDFHAGGYHWPAFNAADSAITVGVAIYIAGSILKKPDEREGAGGAQ